VIVFIFSKVGQDYQVIEPFCLMRENMMSDVRSKK